MTITKEQAAQWALEAGDDWHHTLPSDKEIMHKAMQLAYEAGVKQSNADESDMLTIAHLNGFEKGKEAGKSAVSEPVQAFSKEDGLYAVYFLNNWAGEEDIEYVFARLEKGVWVRHETGELLHTFAGDKIIAAWPLNEAGRQSAVSEPVTDVSLYEEGFKCGFEASASYQVEAKAYKEAYFNLVENVASRKAFELLPPILIATPPAAPAKEPDVVMHCDSNTWTINNPPAKGIDDVSLYYKPAQPVQEPVVCKHEWYRTGAMEPGEWRCIKCGVWNNTTPPAQPAPAQEPVTYSSTQATTCAGCFKHKHTPLRIDAMGGYVCLTCIEQKLGSLLGEFGYPEPAEAKREPLTDEQIRNIVLEKFNTIPIPYDIALARAIEAAHGIVNIGAKE